MKKKQILILSSFLIVVLMIILSIIIKNYLAYEKEETRYHNDYNRATIIYALSFYKYPESYYDNIRHQQRYTKGDKYTKTSLINDLKTYDIIDILNYLPDGVEISSLESGLDNLVELLLYMNLYFMDGPESGFVKGDNGYYYIEKDDKYIYKYVKESISKETLTQLFSEYLKDNELNENDYFYELLWNDDLIKSFYDIQGYKILKEDINNKYEDFYHNIAKIINQIISEIFNDFVQYLYDGITISSKRIVEFNYPIEVKTIVLELDYEIFEIQPLYNSNSKYATYLYGVDLDSIKNQLQKRGYPFIFS